jgi:hypothetical protein
VAIAKALGSGGVHLFAVPTDYAKDNELLNNHCPGLVPAKGSRP